MASIGEACQWKPMLLNGGGAVILRSTRELTRYDVEASDGKTGRLGDLYFDDRTWRIRYIVVDAGGFLEHHKVLLSP